MSRRIVFAGGAQTRAVARVFRSEVAAYTGDDVVFIGTGAVGTDAARSTLMMADVVAMEVDEDGDAIAASELPGQAAIVRVPNLYCDFLWPFAGRAHPRNRGAFALPGGPYPAEHGDRFLDQMVAEGVDPDTAMARYKAMDVVTDGELDSRLTDRLAMIGQLDRAAGTDLADYIADRFRAEPLFRTRQRVTMPLLQRLVGQVFTHLGVQGWNPGGLRRVPFPAGAQPIHPGVIAHFGLTWVGPDQEYPVNEEGFFNFDSFGRRYMAFAWNEALHRGIQTAKTDPKAALADLEQGLTESPESPLGHLALAAARRAAGLDDSPADPAAIIDEDSYDPVLEAAGPAVPDASPENAAPADVGAGSDGHAAAPDDPALAAAAPGPIGAEPSAADPSVVVDETTAFTPDDASGEAAEPEADLLGEAAPALAPVEPVATLHPSDDPDAGAYGSLEDEDLIGDAAPSTDVPPATDEAPPAPADNAPDPAPAVRFQAPPKPASPAPRVPQGNDAPRPGSIADGFTDFRPAAPQQAEPALANPGHDLIEVLPRMLPVFADLASAVDRPFDAMPEVMPPPPLRPILPPELQGEPARPGLLARMLGRK